MSSISNRLNSNCFNGKVILITGSSSGFGEETAIQFAKQNANLVINGRNAERVHTVADKCRKWTQNKVLEVVVDLHNESHIKNLVQKTIETFGRIDILVNNAGIISQALLSDSDYLEKFDQVMQTNIHSVVLLTSLVVPHLEVTKGCIVNVSSISSLIPRRTWSGYAMSKCALNMFTKYMATELGPKGIRVNAIVAGITVTPILDAMLKDMVYNKDEVVMYCEMAYPLGRPGSVEDMANAIEFLASDKASFITGVLMIVDGGGHIENRSRL